ncbi:hypothetical protein [Marinomonas atlantica]|uniref:hypothetical protein n=1 Tax=Marinomonas atlantica TaxID=1806668 RepID=UPI000829C5E4|nr:hypothetical protein [Marinomonas atlantica]
MNKNDFYYAQDVVASFKQCIISNIFSTGLQVQRFQIRFEDIKHATNRVRLSPAIIDGYLEFLGQQGIEAFSDGVFSIMCEVDLTRTYLTPAEAESISSNMNAYYTRIAYEQSS